MTVHIPRIGQPARGQTFLGRRRLVDLLVEDIVESGNSLAIVGLGRIGKSSVGYRLFDRLNERGDHIAIRCDLQSFSSSKAVLEEIADEIQAAGDRLGLDKMRRPDVESLDDTVTRLRRCVRSLARKDIKVHCIIDEFDDIKRLQDADDLCRILRSFANETGKSHLSLVAISRRPVSHLETTYSDISNLDGILKKVYVKCFDQEDMDDVNGRLLQPLGLVDSDMTALTNAIGGHPFFLALFVDSLRSHNGLAAALSHFQREREEYYEMLDRFMRDIKASLAGSIAAYVMGYRQAPREDLVLLARYGLINQEDSLGFTLSNEYAAFLAADRFSANTSALWNQVEKRLRVVLSEMLDRKYGPDWRSQPDVLRPVLPDIDKIMERKNAAESSWGTAAGATPLSFCYPAHYWRVIKSHRGELAATFTSSQDWGKCFDDVIMIRNPSAHNWLEQIDRAKVMSAETSLKAILKALSVR